MLWLVEVRLRKLIKLTVLLFAVSLLYRFTSPSTTPAMTYSLFLFILAFPVCSVAFENVILELKNPVSRLRYSLSLMFSYLLVFLLPLGPFVFTKNFLNALPIAASGVSAGLFFGSIGLNVKLSAVLPILFLMTFFPLLGLSPLLSLWNPLLASFKGLDPQLASISLYSMLYLGVMKKREWRG